MDTTQNENVLFCSVLSIVELIDHQY